MVSIGRAVLVVIFIFACIGIVQVAGAADVGHMNLTLRTNESLSGMAFQGDRMYVSGSYVVNYKAIGEVFIYDRAGALVSKFDITDPNPNDLYGMHPYGICMNDDGSVTVWTL
jgi:hypothetical protein